MTIAFQDVFPVLAQALPDFKASEEDWEDRISYAFLSDMVRFVCDRGYPGSDGLMTGFARLLETLLILGDSDVKDLVHDALESVWAREERDFVAMHFGLKTSELWTRICAGERGQ
jgi:hypothetical protein